MADIFVSYTSSDRDWAFWIAKELKALGHTPRVYEWEVKGGEDIYGWMQERHDAADHVLCVISDDYMKAPYSTLERHAALWQAASKRPGFVLFAAVKPCRLPTLSDHISRCELFGVPEDAARTRFRAFMAKRETPQKAAFPGKAFAVSNIPIRVPEHFLGRDDSLSAIEMALKRYEGRVAVTALHGLRGVGKTTLAAAYAERHRGDYRTTWWIRAQTPDGMRADLVALGVRLGWVAADEKEEPALAKVMERLRHEGEGVLLIYDNAIDSGSLKPYLPPGGTARVIVTSNAHAWRGVAEPVDIRLWPKEIGADFLIARTGRSEEREPALKLSEALGGLPLAHEQAAAYCERLDVSLADYAKRFNDAPARLLDAVRDAPGEYHDGLTVAKTFALAIDEAAKLHPAAEPLIAHAALLAPDPIPLFLFLEGREHFGEPLATALTGDGLDEAVAALRAFALVDREAIPDERDPTITTDCIRLHRLVRQVASVRQHGESLEDAKGRLINGLAAVYPGRVFGDPAVWPRARRLDAHALALVGARTDPPKGAEERASNLIAGLASYRQGALAAYADARPLFECALAINEKALGPQHPSTAASLNNLGLLLRVQGDLAGARPILERALAIKEKARGPEHHDTATGLNNLAGLLQDQGDLQAARPFFERALAIREKALGPEHPETATSLNNLALLSQAEGDLVGARSLFERALAVYQKALGPEHPRVAGALNNLGILTRIKGDYAGARPLLERAVAIWSKTLGDEHPDTNRGRSNLARLLIVTGEASEAFRMSDAALAAHERLLGPDHRWTADTATVAADALDVLGRADEAAALRARYGLDPKAQPAAGQG